MPTLPGGKGPNLATEFVVPKGPFFDGQTVPVCSYVTNANGPQVGYALLTGTALIIASAMNPQGPSYSAEYQFGTHAAQLYNAEAAKTQIRPSVRTPPVNSGILGKYVSAAPLETDTQIAAWSIEAAPLAVGPVPAYTTALQVNPLPLAAQIWQALRTQPITTGILGKYVSIQPQQPDTYQPVLSRPLIIGQGPVPPSVWASQDNQFPGAAQVWKSVTTQPVTTGILGKTIYAHLPLAYDFNQSAQITASSPTPPVIITGPTVRPNDTVQQQWDFSVNPSVVWTPSTFSPSGPIPPTPPDVGAATPGRTLSGRTLLRPEFKVESEQDKRDRRAREALEDAPRPKQPDLSAYYKQSARIGKAISDARAEAEALKPRIAELEAKAAKAQMQAKAKLEKQLLLAQQQLTLISVQEAVLMEEQEAIDIAFIALIAYLTATS